MSKLFAELKRRHMFRVAIAYAVTAWLLLQLGEIVFPVVHAPSWCEGVLLAFLVLGFPLALFLTWAFEVTPEGVRRTEPAEADDARTLAQGRRIGQRIDFAIIAVLAAAVAVLAWRLSAQSQRPAPAAVAAAAPATSHAAPAAAVTAVPPKSVAVLPFENLAPDRNNAYFAAGMQDMILTKLAEIGGLKVISRTSTQDYPSHPQDLESIAHALGVATILEGSVQKAGDEVLINVQLIDARSDNHIWAQSFQRTLKNVFGVEGEVAQKVAAALKAKLDPAEQARVEAVPTRNPDAYDAYLRALVQHAHTNGQSPAVLRATAVDYRRAVKLDPGFASAWAHLSSINSFAYFSFIDHSPARLAKAKREVDRALALAPDGEEAQLALGDYDYGLRHYSRALIAYRKVLSAAPHNVHALAWTGYVERRLGHWQTSIDYQERALRFDPRDVQKLTDLGESYLCLLRFAKAQGLFKRALAINPGDPFVTARLATAYQNEGELAPAGRVLAAARIAPGDSDFTTAVQQALFTHRYGKATRLLRKALKRKATLSKEDRGDYYRLLGLAEQLAGNRDSARLAYDRAVAALERAPESPSALDAMAMAQAGLGEKDPALASARRAIELLPTSRDAYVGPVAEVFLAAVHAQVGDRAQAVASLRRLLAALPGSFGSYYLTPALMKIDPIWNPLRVDPAFQALIHEAASGTRRPRAAGGK